MSLFDAHFHIIDPRFPCRTNQGYRPEPFTVADYLERTTSLGITGGAVVSGSFQGFDQGYLEAALEALGSGFVGVTQLPADTPDAEIVRLDKRGVRAVRFNLKRGGSETVAHLRDFGHRVHALAGWHVELYVDSGDLPELESTLLRLPAVSIDHLGLRRAGFDTLLRLAEKGVAVKATGFGRVEMDIVETLRTLHRANPGALMFGTDLPATRAPRPFREADIQLIQDTFDDAAARRILNDNARAFYRCGP